MCEKCEYSRYSTKAKKASTVCVSTNVKEVATKNYINLIYKRLNL